MLRVIRVEDFDAKRDETITFRVSEALAFWLGRHAYERGMRKSILIFHLVSGYAKRQERKRTRKEAA